MILDYQNLFSNAQAVTATAVSTNVIDLTVARDLGVGSPSLRVWVQVTTAFVSAGGATLAVAFQGSVDNSTYTDMASSRTYAVVDLGAGKLLLPIMLPRVGGAQAYPLYYRLNYTVATSTFSAGALTAGLVLDVGTEMAKGYAAGINPAT